MCWEDHQYGALQMSCYTKETTPVYKSINQLLPGPIAFHIEDFHWQVRLPNSALFSKGKLDQQKENKSKSKNL